MNALVALTMNNDPNALLTFDISGLLKKQALEHPNRLAIIAADLELSYHKLDLLVEAYAFKLRQSGVRSGDCITVNSSDAIVSTVAIFAIALADAIFIPFDPGIRQLQEPAVSICLRTEEKKPYPGTRDLVIDGSWSPKNFPESLNFHAKDRPNQAKDVTWIVPSSGTTGRQKYSPLSSELLFKRLDAIAEDYEGKGARILLLFMPCTRPFVIRAIAALTHGKTLVDSRDANFAIKQKVTIVCASPQQITAWPDELEFMTKLPLLQVSGAKLPNPLIVRMLNNFEAVEDVYGANETIKSHVNVYRLVDEKMQCIAKPGNQFVQIADSAGNQCPAGVDGTVRVKTPFMTDRYLNDESATEKSFRDGWFYPGDIGRIDDDGVLEVIGRTDDVINLGGEKHLLSDIDEVLSSAEGIKYASAFKKPILADTIEIAVCVVLKGKENRAKSLFGMHQAALQKLSQTIVPTTFLVVDDLDLTPDGVPVRRKAEAKFIEIISRADPIEISQRLFYIGADK
jgi:acyl-CoA synthetase (AMP-forming)/AMP-acid ligase II